MDSRKVQFLSPLTFRICTLLTSLMLMAAGTVTVHSKEALPQPSFEGVWMPSHVSLDDPRWRIVDLTCGGMCSLEQFDFLQSLLNDPANDDTSVEQLFTRSYEYYVDNSHALLTAEGLQQVKNYKLEKGAASDCTPDGDGISTQLFAPLPSEIKEYDDHIQIQYEYWNALRIIYTDGRDHPEGEKHSRLGHSIGSYEGNTLIVDTVRLLPGELYLPVDGGLTAIMLSKQARLTERYSLSEDGQRLDLIWSISDPTYLHRAVQGQKSALLASDWTLNEFVCESFTGEY